MSTETRGKFPAFLHFLSTRSTETWVFFAVGVLLGAIFL